MANGYISKPASAERKFMLGGDQTILQKRYKKSSDLNKDQQLKNIKMQKLLDEKNEEIGKMQFFKNACFALHEQGLMDDHGRLTSK